MDRCIECDSLVFDEAAYCKRCKENNKGGDVLLSAGIAAVTDSAIIGGLIGGSFLGGILGDSLDGDLWD